MHLTAAGPDPSLSDTVALAEPLPQPFGPEVQLYRVRPQAAGVASPSPSTVFRASRLAAGAIELRLDEEYDGLEPGALLVLSDGQAEAVHAVDSTRVDEEQTVVTLTPPTAVDFFVATLTVYGPFELAMRVDGYDRSEESTLAGATSLTLDGRISGLKPTDYIVVEGGGAEGARLTAVTYDHDGNTVVDIESPFENAYPWATAVVFGNVAAVSHGETVVEEVLGSGDRSQAQQSFRLRRRPTTFVHDAAGIRGVANSLEVFIDDQRWREVESLAESGPQDPHYVVHINDEDSMSFQFGDDRHGAKPTTGVNNIHVRYRVGIGGGNVGPGTIVKMPQALPFLAATRNPVGAAGGEDRESIETTKRLAPVTVRTLDRAVSLSDYADLALAYAGIAKARTEWSREEGRRIVRLVVAATEGAAAHAHPQGRSARLSRRPPAAASAAAYRRPSPSSGSPRNPCRGAS